MKKTRRGRRPQDEAAKPEGQAAKPPGEAAKPRPEDTKPAAASDRSPAEAARPAAPDPAATSAAAPARAAGRSFFDVVAARLPWCALLVVALFAIRRLDDFDTWWHLASGRWIVRNFAIPRTDVLSFTVPGNEWVNLQWLYDALLYGLWTLGGADALVLSSAACFVGTFALLARHLRLHAGALVTTLMLLWVATMVNERFLIRPEMASFPLLAAVQLVLAEGRSAPARLRWLVPLMILWANMHSLFILGVAAIGCAVAGAFVAELPLLPAAWRRDSAWPVAARRELVAWGAAAVAATLANPYFHRALLFPLELMTRIDGSSGVYAAIGEFRPPFSGYFLTFAIGSYQVFVFFFVAVAIVAGLVRATSRGPKPGAAAGPAPAFDVGALAFAAALAWLSLLARRNVGIFAIGAVPFVGACVAILAARLPRAWQAASALPMRAASFGVVAASAAIGGLVVTNHWYAVTGETHEFGLGIFESNFQPRAVEFFRELNLPGPTFNDMTAGGYLTWDDPTGRGVYVDGRLEVYDTPFFGAYLSSLSNLQAWRRDADARGIQSVMIFHRWGNRHPFLQALGSLPEWRIVYYDETVATFVRASEHPDVAAAAREAFPRTWHQKTREKLERPWRAASWQWNIDRYTAAIAYGRLLETMGDRQGAQWAFEKALEIGLPPDYEVETRQRVAQYHAAAGRFAEARLQLEKAAEVAPGNEQTRAMLSKLDGVSR